MKRESSHLILVLNYGRITTTSRYPLRFTTGYHKKLSGKGRLLSVPYKQQAPRIANQGNP